MAVVIVAFTCFMPFVINLVNAINCLLVITFELLVDLGADVFLASLSVDYATYA